MTTAAPQLASPRLALLQHAVETRNSSAIAAFWQEIGEGGTPLVEPLAGDDGHALVTFLWRATEPVDTVVLGGGPAGWRGVAVDQLTPLPATDLWYRTYRLRGDFRFRYAIAPNGATTVPATMGALVTHMAAFRPDPLNHHPRNSAASSVAELPGAPPQPWSEVRDGVPCGTVQQYRRPSAILGNERDVWVYTPPGFTHTGAAYGLLMLFDGEQTVAEATIPTLLDNLQADGAIPPLVTVMVGNAQGARALELPCHPPFVEFLTEELLPWVRREFNCTQDPARVFVGGSSFGGLASVFAGLQRPDVFGNVLALSGSFFWCPNFAGEHATGEEPEPEWLTRQFVERERLPLRFYLYAGRLERNVGGPFPEPGILVGTRHLRDVLRLKGYEVHYAELVAEHDMEAWRSALAGGLVVLAGMEAPKLTAR